MLRNGGWRHLPAFPLAIANERSVVPDGAYYLAVTLPADRAVIGFARLGLAGVRAAKLGFAIRHSQWGHGYATDAARTLITFGLGELGLHRISAAAGPENAASIAIIKQLGMTYEGRIRDHVYTNGAWRDSLLYSLAIAPRWWRITATTYPVWHD